MGVRQQVSQPASVEPATVPRTGGDAALITLAKMFESFMAVQKERDEMAGEGGNKAGAELQSPEPSSHPTATGLGAYQNGPSCSKKTSLGGVRLGAPG